MEACKENADKIVNGGKESEGENENEENTGNLENGENDKK